MSLDVCISSVRTCVRSRVSVSIGVAALVVWCLQGVKVCVPLVLVCIEGAEFA